MNIFNRIQFRVILLILIISVFFCIGLYYLRENEQRKVEALLKDKKQEKTALLVKVVGVLGHSLYQFVYDYSYWDDMLKFVSVPDPKWAYVNIETVMPTFNSHAAWVVKPDLSLVYAKNIICSASLDSLPVPKNELMLIIKKNEFFHFYIPYESDVMEIQGAPIQPSSDIDRLTEPAGYLIVGRLWNKDYIDEMSGIASGKITLHAGKEKVTTSVDSKETIRVVMPLTDWNAKRVSSVILENNLTLINRAEKNAEFLFFYGIVFSLLVITTISVFLFRYVSNPLSKVYECLQKEDPGLISDLKNSRTEFGNLALIITEFFSQKKKLVGEIENRKEAQVRLKETNEVLVLLNEKLTASENELRELNVSKDKFFSILAHDLKSPYQGLMGISKILSDEISTLSEDDIRVLSGEMYRTVKNQYRLLENLLEWSRIQIGKEEYNPEEIQLHLLVNSVYSLLAYNADKKNIELKNCINPRTIVFADMHMLRSILVNLISNAVKFTDSKGEVTVTCDSVNGFHRITVRDTGVGISSEDMAKIFKMDSHHSTRGTENEEGTGLGLILCRELVEKHGGTIKAESVPWCGSAFSFTLPEKPVIK